MNIDDGKAENIVKKYSLMEFYSQTDSPSGNDIRYAYFRIYKRKLLYQLFLAALTARKAEGDGPCRILDCGCGFASDLEYIVCRLTDYWKEWPPAKRIKYHGIDADERALAFAHQHWAHLSLDAEFRIGDISRSLPYETGHFDIVICSEVVEHLAAPENLLREIRRVLIKDGLLVFTTNNKPTVLGLIKSLFLGRPAAEKEKNESCAADGQSIHAHGHIHMRKAGYWENLCKKTGFKIVSFGSYESVQRSGSNTPASLFLFFFLNFVVSLLPRRIGRYFGCTTVMLLKA